MLGVPAQGNPVNKPTGRASWMLCAASAFLLLASCATVPQRSPLEWMGVLPADATMYISVAVPKSADLIHKTLKEGGPAYNDVITLSDMTKRLLVSVTVSKDSPLQFAAVALGGYPSALIGWSLAGKKEWKQVTVQDGSYYAWNKANLQLSIPNGSILLAANGQMPTLLSQYKVPVPLPLPPEVVTDMEKTDIVIYMPQLPGGIGDLPADQPGKQPGDQPGDQPVAADSVDRPHFTIRDVWVDAVKTRDGYIMGGTMNTDTEQQARVLSLLLRVGIIAWMKSNNVPNTAERLRTITVFPQGSSVKVNGIAVGDAELMPLILTLLNGPPSGGGVGAAGDAAAPQQAN
jgi:hypothetical protein